GKVLSTPSTPTSSFTPSYQRQTASLVSSPVVMHAMATIPQQPSYRAPTDRIFYLAHTCQPACLNRVRPAKSDLHRGKNPLLTPLLYDFRRMTGRRKVNRKVRLQLFKTQNKGWGIRCLDDIAKGSFVCIYAGKILTDDFADKEGLEMGDEYFANLDHIESVENFKEGYESEAHCSDTSVSAVTKKQVAVKSTRGIALKNSHSLMVKTGPSGGGVGPSTQGGKPGQQGQPGGGAEYAPKNTRLFFDGEESCYIIDANQSAQTANPEHKLFSFGGFGCFLVFWNIFSMFYYPAVLNRQSGCFATICDTKWSHNDIMSYVLERVAPPQPGLPRPRFSLYLSSQLQYGVVLVYHRQCTILLEELQFIVGQLLKQRSLQKIDLDDHRRAGSSCGSTLTSQRPAHPSLCTQPPLTAFCNEGTTQEPRVRADDSLPLEASDQKEVSREISPLYTSEREGSTFSTVLQDIPEMVDEMMERVAAESPRLLPELMELEEPVVFQSLLPPEVNRRTVSSIFHRLLGEELPFSTSNLPSLMLKLSLFYSINTRKASLINMWCLSNDNTVCKKLMSFK
ncbi:hypothetical protein GOODEAATRI_002115, partial [Goodea atripinnis]